MAGSTASASLGLGDGVAASDLGEPQASSSGRRVTISYEEANADDIFVPAPPGRTLKINVDLLLWRCRQARLKAQLCLDAEQRRELMKEAESGLRRCLALDPADPRTYVVLGKTLMVQRRFDEARALYAEGVTNTGNSNPYIWSAWGWLEFKTGNVARARQLFDAAIVVDGTHACAWHKWGLLEKSEGNYLKARDLWMQGIRRCKRKPQSQNAYLFNALAVMAAELQRVSEARAWFDEGTSTTEGAASVALWQAWAVLEARQGDPTAVRYLFKKALGANPKSRYVHLAWALWERQSGNMLACLELLQRGVAHNPTDAALYQARALVEWRDFSRPERAREVFEEGLRADPGHLPLWQAWGCMEAQLGNVERARELFQQGVWADPRNRDTVWVFHAWGCLERGQGNLQLARELFKAAIKVEPKADKVWFTWIAMETDGGFAERADELRIRQAEQQWEFEVPAGFTTRPGGLGSAPTGAAAAAAAAAAGAGAGQAGGQPGGASAAAVAAAAAAGEVVAAALSPLASLRDTLAQFFKARAGKAPNGSSQQAPQSWGPAQPFLPSDFQGDLSVEDALREPQQGLQQGAGRPAASAASAAAAVDRAASLLLTPAATGAGDAPSAATGPAPLQPSLSLQAAAAAAAQLEQQQPQQEDGATVLVFSASVGAEDDGEHDVQARALAAATSTPSSSTKGVTSKRRAPQPGPRGAGRASSRSPAPTSKGSAGAKLQAAEGRRAAGYRGGAARPAPQGAGDSPALVAKPVRHAATPDAPAAAPQEPQGGPQAAPEPAAAPPTPHHEQAVAPALATVAGRGG